MSEKSWNEWVQVIADQYDLDLDKTDKETQKQKKILESAIHTFAEKGFSGASTSEIAERAGVAEATIFKHYRTKKGLLLRLVIPAIAKVASPMIVRPVLKILDQEKPLNEIIEDLVLDRLHLFENNWKQIKIIFIEAFFHPEIREALKNHVAKNIFSIVSERMDELKKAGKVRNDLPNHVLVRSILSMIMGYLFARNVVPDLLAQQEEKEELRMIADVLINGIAPDPVGRNDHER